MFLTFQQKPKTSQKYKGLSFLADSVARTFDFTSLTRIAD